jgi:hypothetical protein
MPVFLDPLFPAIMYFVENSAFGKILKLFIRSDYLEMNCIWLIF